MPRQLSGLAFDAVRRRIGCGRALRRPVVHAAQLEQRRVQHHLGQEGASPRLQELLRVDLPSDALSADESDIDRHSAECERLLR